MATLGLLGKLPLELRNEIYSLVLALEEVITIEIWCHKGDTNRQVLRRQRRQHPLRKGNRRVSIKSNEAALLFVSKQVCAETGPILYGTRTFQFLCMSMLQLFLNQIKHNTQHLCNGNIVSCGWGASESFATAHCVITALRVARGLHTPGISYWDVHHYSEETERAEYLKEIVAICKPLLQDLKESRVSNDVATSILDVLRLDLTPSISQR